MANQEVVDRLRDWFDVNFRQNDTRPKPVWVRGSHIKDKLDAIGLPYPNRLVGEEMARLGFSRKAFRLGNFVVKVWAFGDASKDDEEIVLDKAKRGAT